MGAYTSGAPGRLEREADESKAGVKKVKLWNPQEASVVAHCYKTVELQF